MAMNMLFTGSPQAAPPRIEGPLFEQVTALPALDAAWRRVKRNGGAPGGDGVGIDGFARDAGRRLRALHTDLRSGNYRPGPLRRVAVPKPQGGERVLAIPCIADRIIQGAVAGLLTEILDGLMHSGSFGYRPGRSVGQAVALVSGLRDQGLKHIVDADIRK